MKKLKLIISSSKHRKGGTWCIDGTRIPVWVIMEHLDKGWTPTDLERKLFPQLRGKLNL